MKPLSFPDVNVWLALSAVEHVHGTIARQWWKDASGPIAFTRLTQLSLLRLMTSSIIMDGKPMTNTQALRVYDRFFQDGRVIFVAEAPDLEERFRKTASIVSSSPKLWADAWLLAYAQALGGTLVTFDRALASRSSQCLLLAKESNRS
jgi:uncharacterized protein